MIVRSIMLFKFNLFNLLSLLLFLQAAFVQLVSAKPPAVADRLVPVTLDDSVVGITLRCLDAHRKTVWCQEVNGVEETNSLSCRDGLGIFPVSSRCVTSAAAASLFLPSSTSDCSRPLVCHP